MHKLIFGLGAAVLALVLAGDAGARPVVSARPYHLQHGVPHNGGYIYRGEHHNHWSYRVWNARYNRYQYWDPALRCYYYWNPAQLAYYPCN